MVETRILPGKSEIGHEAAAIGGAAIRDAIAARGEATIVVATGASQLETLKALTADPAIDWSKVTAFHLDEYIGLPTSHPASFRRYLEERFVAPTGGAAAFHPVDGNADPEAETRRLGNLIGGREIDVCFAGIGENCHLAFNDPPADFATDEPFIVVELDEACRRQQLGEGWFGSLDEVPKRAITMTISQMLKSRLMVMSVSDARKAQAVRDALEGEIEPIHPASILQMHPAVVMLLDPPAASLLTRGAGRSDRVRTAGLVDLQVNGFAGIDFNSAAVTAAELDHALEAMLATGVTTCLPTLITAHEPELAARFAALDAAIAESRLGPLMCPGYHLEGPFLNPAPGYCGCHPPDAMGPADPGLVDRLASRLLRPILLVTVAPEMAGAQALVAALRRSGRVVAIGHSAVDAEQAGEAANAGATLSTHLGNGLPQTLPKLANPLFAQLAEDRLSATFIADGIHLPPPALKAMIRAKGLSRTILVTDAVSAAAAPPGRYPFAGMEVERTADGTVRVPGTVGLAGSSLCLDQAVRNGVAWGIFSPEEAIAAASTWPLRALAPALAGRSISLADSEVEWTADLRPVHVRIGAITRRFSAAATA